MKKFLKHICLFSSVLILLSIGFEITLRRIPNSYRFKRNIVEKKGEEIKNLIIGSSVVNCGIDPAYLSDSTYNLAISGQWLRYNQVLLERYIDRLPHLKNIIWGISYQTLWLDDYIGQDKISIANHKIYMDIDKHKDILYNIELLSTGSISFRKWSKYYILHKKTMSCDSLGLDHSYDLSERGRTWVEDIPRQIKGHSIAENEKTEKLFKENVRRIDEVAELCRTRGIRLYLVIPPVHRKYYELTNAGQVEKMCAALEAVAAKWDNVRFYNYFNDKRFEDDDNFHNGNHLSSDKGAVRFTRILRKDILNNDSTSVTPL